MFITTAGRTNEEMTRRAKSIAEELNVSFVRRDKRSIQAIQQLLLDDCIVVGKEKLELFPYGEIEPFFFHPNSSMFRIKRLIEGEQDPFVTACQLKEGSRFLDCTLGLASDSIVASHIVGSEGRVVGIEGNRYLAYVVNDGLKSWDSNVVKVRDALKRVEVIHAISLDYLKSCEDNSFDVVYFDPMFDVSITESDGIKGLSKIALYEDISDEMIFHGKRVARTRVVLKDHFRSKRFEKYNFNVHKRKTAKFHFGVIEI